MEERTIKTEVKTEARPTATRAKIETAQTQGVPDFVKKLQKETKIKVRIKEDPKDKNDVPVCINGYIWQIKRGEFVEVPETVAKILAQAGYI
jgi:maltose-binding protein MalE